MIEIRDGSVQKVVYIGRSPMPNNTNCRTQRFNNPKQTWMFLLHHIAIKVPTCIKIGDKCL